MVLNLWESLRIPPMLLLLPLMLRIFPTSSVLYLIPACCFQWKRVLRNLRGNCFKFSRKKIMWAIDKGNTSIILLKELQKILGLNVLVLLLIAQSYRLVVFCLFCPLCRLEHKPKISTERAINRKRKYVVDYRSICFHDWYQNPIRNGKMLTK